MSEVVIDTDEAAKWIAEAKADANRFTAELNRTSQHSDSVKSDASMFDTDVNQIVAQQGV